MLPVKTFKTFKLISVNKKKIVKKLVSSGTTGQNLSEIYLDKKNAKNQIIILSKIIEEILGKKRLPMLIIDQNPKLSNRSIFNARAAAIFGFSLFGKDYCYLLNNKNEIVIPKIVKSTALLNISVLITYLLINIFIYRTIKLKNCTIIEYNSQKSLIVLI